jgi:hypothetical protein
MSQDQDKDKGTKGRLSESGIGQPAVLVALAILALIGVFAWFGGASLVRPAGTGNAVVTGQPVQGEATVHDSVQRITVDPATGIFVPNVIVARAGTPLQIAFKPGSGCLGSVMFKDFGITQEISQGGIVELPALKPGEYSFSCGMRMVFGKVVVR